MKFREGRANVPEGLFAEEESPARRRKSSTSKVASGLVERRRDLASRQQSGREERYHHQHHGDDYSDRGTYTIELENGDQEEEEEEARKMIDKVRTQIGFVRSESTANSVLNESFFWIWWQVFGVEEQEAVCLSRLAGGEQRERLGSQRSSTGERGKPGRMETEVLSPSAVFPWTV